MYRQIIIKRREVILLLKKIFREREIWQSALIVFNLPKKEIVMSPQDFRLVEGHPDNHFQEILYMVIELDIF
jgi:hypothetical protein